MLRSVRLEILPGLIRLHIDGQLPLVGDRVVTADLSASLRGGELWMRLERTSVPLLPKAALVNLVASQAQLPELRADGANLILDLTALFRQYEIETTVSSLEIESGRARLYCRG
jgi:hypothetical protein